MRSLILLLLSVLAVTATRAQSFAVTTDSTAGSRLSGRVTDDQEQAVGYANVALYQSLDSVLVRVEVTDDDGRFAFRDLIPGTYDLSVTFLGAPELRLTDLEVTADQDLGTLTLAPAAVELTEATVTATRALVEVHPDRTVFNVQGTINAAGNDGLSLLRKAPGVTVDNNDNISVLSRSGVQVFVDGKLLPLSGTDLSTYLRSLRAEQIDRIDIITNPGAKYEAQGNAGIIDIRLKKSENEGANGNVALTGSQGQYSQYNLSGGGNYRNKQLNAFGSGSFGRDWNFEAMDMRNFQNGLLLDQAYRGFGRYSNSSVRGGVDYFLNERTTVGILYDGRFHDGRATDRNDVGIYGNDLTGTLPDSLLRAITTRRANFNRSAFNVNYRYAAAPGHSLNVDLDYGRYRNDELASQTNRYYLPDDSPVTGFDNRFDTPVNIDIYTAKLDYERPIGKAATSSGVKISHVSTDNHFGFFDGQPNDWVLNTTRSNDFTYQENVYAGYASLNAPLGAKWSYSAGLRVEVTDAVGTLTPYTEEQTEDPVNINYISSFPNAGVTWQVSESNTLNLNYGRRINRPNYQVLNPFRQQISELTYEKGNPYLRPEIVDNVELGYTLAQRYNFKLSYSQTADQIARLIRPDDTDPRGGYVSWDNLATQRLVALNASVPVGISPKWNAFVNASTSYIDNRADYGDGATVNVQAFTYNVFMQHTITLPGGLVGEVSGYFSGPGVWGGVFRYQPNGSLDLGLQRKFLDDRLAVKLSANDLLYTSQIRGESIFDGLHSELRAYRDSRRVGISLSYAVGNQQVRSRNRDTGLESEARRTGQ